MPCSVSLSAHNSKYPPAGIVVESGYVVGIIYSVVDAKSSVIYIPPISTALAPEL